MTKPEWNSLSSVLARNRDNGYHPVLYLHKLLNPLATNLQEIWCLPQKTKKPINLCLKCALKEYKRVNSEPAVNIRN